MVISIVIPVFNGAATIGDLVNRLIDVLSTNTLQIVLVNDGSADQSDRACRALYLRYPETVTYINLSKNFGEHNAVMAGLRHARGDYVIIMDDDFQNPPEEVTRLIEYACTHGYDIVYSRYPRKQHHWFRNFGSRLNDRVANFMLDKPRNLYLSSFKCLSRFTVGEIIKYTGPYPYIDGLALRCTQHRHSRSHASTKEERPVQLHPAAVNPPMAQHVRQLLGNAHAAERLDGPGFQHFRLPVGRPRLYRKNAAPGSADRLGLGLSSHRSVFRRAAADARSDRRVSGPAFPYEQSDAPVRRTRSSRRQGALAHSPS